MLTNGQYTDARDESLYTFNYHGNKKLMYDCNSRQYLPLILEWLSNPTTLSRKLMENYVQNHFKNSCFESVSCLQSYLLNRRSQD